MDRMELNLTGMLKRIGKGYYKIIQYKKNKEVIRSKNNQNQLQTFISDISQGKLKEYQTDGDCKVILKFTDDSDNDRWEVIPAIRLIQYQVTAYSRKVIDDELISKQLGLCLLVGIGQTQRITDTDIIEVVNYVSNGQVEYILKDKLEQKIDTIKFGDKGLADAV